MSVDRIGTREPADLGELVETRLPDEDTGMVYDIHTNRDDWDDRLIVGKYHEDVGLVTWYYYDPNEVEYRSLILSTYPIGD